jgi:hypothetical protein
LKGAAASYKINAKVDLPAGIYSWAVAIVDTTKENKPAIQLALDGDLTAQGWTKLSALQVK